MITRRLLLTVTLACAQLPALAAPHLGPRDIDKLPSRPADARIAYAGDDQLQFGELRLPDGAGPFPVAIVIHGGCWVSTFATLQNTTALADALREAGVATWNLEYRRLDHAGGGWPGTFRDVAAGADHVRMLAKQYPLDLARVVVVGHSAGAHLALWVAARSRIAPDSPLYASDPVALRAAVALGGPGDLRDFTTYAADICRAPVIEQLLGGAPGSVPERYAAASPAELLPLGVRQVMIVGAEDHVMPPKSREAYIAAASSAGDAAELIVVPGAGHFEVIAPTAPAWHVVRDTVLGALAIRAQ